MLHVTKNCVTCFKQSWQFFVAYVICIENWLQMIVEKCQFSTSDLWAKHMEIFNNYENSKTLEANANFEITRS